MERRPEPNQFEDLQPVYHLTVGELAAHIRTFMEMRHSLTVGPVGVGLIRALYATYLTYLPDGQFSYPLKKYQDHRGIFVELLKSHDSGQLSYFTAYPGVTRGGHYHHSKTEKFLVVKGSARFRFRHIDSGAFYECCTSAVNPTVVETIPGWSHDITNIGPDEMVVVLWANEVFNRAAPDTIISEVTA
jgi:UDP-2-acetamido-2,6-beta-L-arabino-hexul-4-ose reductase